MSSYLFLDGINQRYFKELTDVDVRGQMFTEQQNVIEADMAPFGFIDDGLNDTEIMNNSFFDDAGELWSCDLSKGRVVKKRIIINIYKGL